jgi:hypothetical protein
MCNHQRKNEAMHIGEMGMEMRRERPVWRRKDLGSGSLCEWKREFVRRCIS